MVYCSVHGCSNERGKSQSKVDGRRFLRFFKLPKDARLAKDWKHRMRRRPEDITDKMVVCSDHFADDDFSTIIKMKNFYYEGMHIKLNPTAVLNTEILKTGDIDCAVPTSSKRSRKRKPTQFDSGHVPIRSTSSKTETCMTVCPSRRKFSRRHLIT